MTFIIQTYSKKYPSRADRGTFIRVVIWTAMRNAKLRRLTWRGISFATAWGHFYWNAIMATWICWSIMKNPLLLMLVKLKTFHVKMVKWGVRACISLAIYTPKEGAKSPCSFYWCNIHYFLRRQLGWLQINWVIWRSELSSLYFCKILLDFSMQSEGFCRSFYWENPCNMQLSK